MMDREKIKSHLRSTSSHSDNLELNHLNHLNNVEYAPSDDSNSHRRLGSALSIKEQAFKCGAYLKEI